MPRWLWILLSSSPSEYKYGNSVLFRSLSQKLLHRVLIQLESAPCAGRRHHATLWVFSTLPEMSVMLMWYFQLYEVTWVHPLPRLEKVIWQLQNDDKRSVCPNTLSVLFDPTRFSTFMHQVFGSDLQIKGHCTNLINGLEFAIQYFCSWCFGLHCLTS